MNWQYVDPGTGYVLGGASAWLVGLLTSAMGALLFWGRFYLRKFQKGPWKWLVAILVVLCVGWLLMNRNAKNELEKRVVVLAIDGMDYRIAQELMSLGQLPNLKGLSVRGDFRALQTTFPPQSPVAWATFATGKNPGKHGVFDFIHRDPDTYGLQLSITPEVDKLSGPIKENGIWDYLQRNEVPCTIIGLPATFPAPRGCDRLLSGMGVPDILGTEGTYTYYVSTKRSGAQDEGSMGGRIEKIQPRSEFVVQLWGPKIKSVGGIRQSSVPARIRQISSGKVELTIGEEKTILEEGVWSAWLDVEFDIGWFRKIRGNVRAYLVESGEQFALYLTPINIDPRAPYLRISTPPSYSNEIARELGLFYTQGMPSNTQAYSDGVLPEVAFLQQLDQIFDHRRSLLEYELKRFSGGLLLVYFDLLDVAQHMFWGERQFEDSKGELISEAYLKMDKLVGDTLNRLDLEKDVLLVLSDHGFSSFHTGVHVNGWLRDKGYLKTKPGLPLDGPDNIDWSRTVAYAVGFGGIYLNLKGRESKGVVSVGDEADSLLSKIAGELVSLKAGPDSAAVFRRVIRSSEIYLGAYDNQAPDLLLGYSEGFRASWQTAVGGSGDGIFEKNTRKWVGDHLIDPELVPGVIYSSEKLSLDVVHLQDLVPSILVKLGIPQRDLDPEFDGRSIWP